MTLQDLVFIAGILTFAALWSKNMLVAISASGGWIFAWIYITNHPALIGAVAGDNTQEILMIVCISAAVAIPWYVVFRERTNKELAESSDRGNGFSVRRFLNHGDIGNRNSPKEHRETVEEYQTRVYRALHPNGGYRRRR